MISNFILCVGSQEPPKTDLQAQVWVIVADEINIQTIGKGEMLSSE